MPTPYFTKRPDEEYTKGFDFEERVESPVTITSAEASAKVVRTNVDATNDVLSNTDGEISGTIVLVSLTGGVANTDYAILLTVTLSDGNIFQEKMIMQVRG